MSSEAEQAIKMAATPSLSHGMIEPTSPPPVDQGILPVIPIDQKEIHSGCKSIHDMNGKSMNDGDSFLYMYGTRHQCLLTIFKQYGQLWITDRDEKPSIPLSDFWYEPTDSKISLLQP